MVADSYIAKRMNNQIGGGVATSAAVGFPIFIFLMDLAIGIARFIGIITWRGSANIYKKAGGEGSYLPNLVCDTMQLIAVGTVIVVWFSGIKARDIHHLILLVTAIIFFITKQWTDAITEVKRFGVPANQKAMSWSGAFASMWIGAGAIVYGVSNWWDEITSAIKSIIVMIVRSEPVMPLVVSVGEMFQSESMAMIRPWMEPALTFVFFVLFFVVPFAYFIRFWIRIAVAAPAGVFFRKNPRLALAFLFQKRKSSAKSDQEDMVKFERALQYPLVSKQMYITKLRAAALKSNSATVVSLVLGSAMFYGIGIVAMNGWYWLTA